MPLYYWLINLTSLHHVCTVMPDLTPVKNAAPYWRTKAFAKFECYRFVTYLVSSSHKLVKQCQTRQNTCLYRKNQKQTKKRSIRPLFSLKPSGDWSNTLFACPQHQGRCQSVSANTLLGTSLQNLASPIPWISSLPLAWFCMKNKHKNCYP